MTHIETMIKIQVFICVICALNLVIRAGQMAAEIIRQARHSKEQG